MTEDREQCLAAGMDAHLGKPIVPSQLADCLERYLAKKGHHDVDLAALREVTGGDTEFERELIATFVTSGDKCLADIMQAVQPNDYETLGKRAHALKGASANIHAHRLSAAASNLETAARAKSLREIDGLVRQVKENLRAVNAQLRNSRLNRALRGLGSRRQRDCGRDLDPGRAISTRTACSCTGTHPPHG